MNFKNLGIKWKIMAIAILGPIVITLVLAYQRIEDIRKGSENTILAKSRAIVYMAESARIEMGKRLEKGIMKPLGSIDKSVRLEAVPVIAAIQMARKNADANGYKFRVPKFNPRNPENEPTPIEAQVINEIKASNLNEKILYEEDQIRYFKPIRLTHDCLFCHGDVKGEKDPMGGIKEGWKAGEIHGVFEIISSMAESKQIVSQAKRNIFMWAVIILSIIFILTFFLLKTYLLKPLQSSTELISKIAKGDMTHSIQINRKDEFGKMITTLNGMGGKLREIIISIRSSASELNNASTELSDISGTMSASVSDVTSRSNTVAAAMEEMTTNAQVVASGAEQMTLTINEISQNAENARSITENAVNQAQSTSARVDELGKAASEIDKVTETITKISEQTNLLALNATIEAARAGSAGKGFAVVANEIKELAKQTTVSTGEIREKIEGIQFSTEATVKEISEITKVINGINEIVTVIATAVEEQSITTKEIANNVSETSEVSREVAKDVTDVLVASQEMAENSLKVNEKSKEQSKLADNLDQMMSNFKV